MNSNTGTNRGLKTLLFYGQRDCEVCAEAKPHLEAFKRANLLKIFVIQVDATRNVISHVDIDPKSTPAYALIDEIFQPLKLHEGLLDADQLEKFAFGDFANDSLKKKRSKNV